MLSILRAQRRFAVFFLGVSVALPMSSLDSDVERLQGRLEAHMGLDSDEVAEINLHEKLLIQLNGLARKSLRRAARWKAGLQVKISSDEMDS